MRSTALTAAFCHRGIRVYTKTSDGDVREGCNNTTDAVLASAATINGSNNIIDLGDGWFPGELRFNCSRESTLCAFAWAGWSQSIFYQTPDGSINERKHQNSWQKTNFVEPDCLKGTNIAAVYSDGGHYICLFFQDSEGWIRYRTAKTFSYDSSVRICKAAKGTGIGATSWNDCREIRLYFQDEDNVIHEYCGSRDTNQWKDSGVTLPLSHPVSDITAVCMDYVHVEVKILFQDDNFDIVEMHRPGGVGPWLKGSFRAAALPHSDIIAYVRIPRDGFPFFVVMWAGQDNVLWQRVNSWGSGWLKATPLAFLQNTGSFLGSWTTTLFTDNACHAERKVIRQLRINSAGICIDGLALDFTDGTSTGWRGTETASPHVFTLNSGEDFTHIFATTDGKCITALQLATSKGRSTPWYGTQTGAVTGWELEGRALAGFVGAASLSVTGLMPLWSERYSTASITNLQSCVTEGEHIRKENDFAAMRCEQLKSLAEDLQHDIDTGLRAPAEHAVQGLVTLSGSVEGLYNKTHEPGPAQPEETKKLLKLCKGQAVVVANRFQTLYEQSRTIMNQSGELSTELTAKLGESGTRMTRLSDLQVVADELKKGAEATAQIMRDNEQTALTSVQNAERTRKEAEGKRTDAQIGRAIRDIFTLGLGRIGDWFNLDQAVDYAEKLVESCGRLLQQSRDDLQRAQADVSRITSEIGGYGTLAVVLVGYRGVLQDTAARGIALRDRTMALTNHALDVSRFLAGLAARSETVRTKLTAAQLAKAILAVEGLIGPQAKVKGLLGDGTDRLDGTLEMIAASDAVADEVKDLI